MAFSCKFFATESALFAAQSATAELESTDWVTATNGLNLLRRVAVHHAEACRPHLCAQPHLVYYKMQQAGLQPPFALKSRLCYYVS